MASILLLTYDKQKSASLQADMTSAGHTCLLVSDADGLARSLAKKPDLAVVDGGSYPSDSEVWHWLLPAPGVKLASIILLVPENRLSEWELNQDVDDFMVDPYRKLEFLSRVRRLLRKAGKLEPGETIKHGDLTIDNAGYEVKVAGQRVDLTYREYQLLRYLATNSGKVVTRENLLTKVWGYDYLGGDRTIDVHIRRLRSKLEDGTHVFIETVRNVGYRFRAQSGESGQQILAVNNSETLTV